MMFVSSGSSALWQTLGEGKAHRVYGKRHNGSTKPDEEGTSLKARDEEEDGDDDDEGEEDEMVLRRRKRKRGDGLDRFVWSNGRECRDVPDGTRDVLQRDIQFALGELAGDESGRRGNILFSDAQKSRVKSCTKLVRVESGFFEKIDERDGEIKRYSREEDGDADALKFAIRERNYDWIPFYSTSNDVETKRKRSSARPKALAVEIKPKCGFTTRQDGKLRYDVKTNRDNGKTSEYDPRKFFEHCEIWSLADGVDHEKLKKQLVQELEHMIETPRNTFRVREAKSGEVLWDATKGGSNAKQRFSNVVSEAFAGRVSLKEFLELLVSALQQDGVLKRLIRAQKYGRMANAYDYFGPDEEDIAMRRLAPASIRQAYNTVVESYNTATNNKGIAIASKQKELKDAIKICQDAILSAIAKDASIIIAVRLIPGGVGCRQPPPPLRKQPLQKYDAYDRSMDVPRGSGQMKDSAPIFAVSVNLCDVGLKSVRKIPVWAELDS